MELLRSVFFIRSEIFNQAKEVRPNVGAPTDLTNIKGFNSSSIELLLNEHIVNSFFSSMAESKDLAMTLHDSEVYKLTGFLHLRSINFLHYFPGLQILGDVPMYLKLSYHKDPPLLTILNETQEIIIAGHFSADFGIQDGATAINLDLDSEVRAYMHFEKANRNVSLGLNTIYIKNITTISSLIQIPNLEILRSDFNNLLVFVMNSANIYAFDHPFHIPEKLPYDVHLTDVDMKIQNGVIGLAVNLTVKD